MTLHDADYGASAAAMKAPATPAHIFWRFFDPSSGKYLSPGIVVKVVRTPLVDDF
ncbi:hypothetical protein [Cupriavidus metallidurans]|uniref:hypothetical protein n=1 Tax=Cupriavidus metallidurans TaxID=119219 RepID=UPI001363E75F|nr:hypothetical protein [Cupriavidus metallidurans]